MLRLGHQQGKGSKFRGGVGAPLQDVFAFLRARESALQRGALPLSPGSPYRLHLTSVCRAGGGPAPHPPPATSDFKAVLSTALVALAWTPVVCICF